MALPFRNISPVGPSPLPSFRGPGMTPPSPLPPMPSAAPQRDSINPMSMMMQYMMWKNMLNQATTPVPQFPQGGFLPWGDSLTMGMEGPDLFGNLGQVSSLLGPTTGAGFFPF